MTKISSRDALDILRYFKIANFDNVPRNIESIKLYQPSENCTLAEFKFQKKQYFVLIDDNAGDDKEYIVSLINKQKDYIKGELLTNPNSEDNNYYAIPFKGKECYLFLVVSDKKRLDSELAKRYPEISRSTWQKYIKLGYIKVNNIPIDSSKHEITDVDSIEVCIPKGLDFSDKSFPIIYIDDNVIVINKPIGVLSHSKGSISQEFTVADFFGRYSSYNLNTNRPGIVHRLDRDTSGIMIGARNEETAKDLQKQFADRKTKKSYIAIVEGHPKLDQALIDLPIGRNPSKPSTFKVDTNGKTATTKYKVIDKTDKYSLIDLQPKTGRTHQLRVHMNYIGTPILGDRVYGKESSRLFLHAHSLEITIPYSSRKIFNAPIPDEFKEYFTNISIR